MKQPNQNQLNGTHSIRQVNKVRSQTGRTQPSRRSPKVESSPEHAANLGAGNSQTRRQAHGDPPPDINVGFSGETEEVTITVRGRTLLNASLAAAQLCIPLQKMLSVMARDLNTEINDELATNQSGGLWDMLNVIEYQSPKTKALAMANMATVSRAHRLTWIKQQLPQLSQVWPEGPSAATAPKRIYCDGRNYFAYVAQPEELLLYESCAAVFRFMNGGPLERPCISKWA